MLPVSEHTTPSTNSSASPRGGAFAPPSPPSFPNKLRRARVGCTWELRRTWLCRGKAALLHAIAAATPHQYSRCTSVTCSLDVDRLDVSPTQALSRSEEVLGAPRAAASSRTPPRRVQRSARPFYDGVDAKGTLCRAHQIGGAAAVRFPSRVPKYNVTSYTHNRVHACGSERRRALRGSSRSIRRSPTACGPC